MTNLNTIKNLMIVRNFTLSEYDPGHQRIPENVTLTFEDDNYTLSVFVDLEDHPEAETDEWYFDDQAVLDRIYKDLEDSEFELEVK